MAIVTFPSLADCEVVEVEFVVLAGGVQRRRLLVDSGFTGASSFVLGADEADLIHAAVDPAPATGALQGEQERAWVAWRVPGLSLQRASIAILTDLTPLSLPDGIHGMVGLTFLRSFPRWGSEQMADGWRFFLSAGSP